MRKNECINIPIQGSAFHCLLWSFIQVDKISREQNWKSRLIGQIHDAMVLDVHPDELDMVASTVHKVTCEDLSKHWSWINVPLEVEAEVCPVDGSWNEKSDYHFK
jgi:DNA polymerase-1